MVNTNFKDHFSSGYAAYRPTYPIELVDELVDELVNISPVLRKA